MQQNELKKDWLTYEFKPYFFILFGAAALFFKTNLLLTTSQSTVAYLCVALLFFAGYRILSLRSDYRARVFRK